MRTPEPGSQGSNLGQLSIRLIQISGEEGNVFPYSRMPTEKEFVKPNTSPHNVLLISKGNGNFPVEKHGRPYLNQVVKTNLTNDGTRASPGLQA